MEIIFLLLPLSVCLALAGLTAYIWGVKDGQFDDLETPAIRMLFDEEEKSSKSSHDEE